MTNTHDETHIYGLIDPRDRTLFYVGKANDPMQRTRTHMTPTALKATSPKAAHMRSIMDAGLQPEMVILERVSKGDAPAAEERWIATFRATGTLKNVSAHCSQTDITGRLNRASSRTPDELLRFRTHRGWSQARLARELGVHYSTVSLWESGKRKIPKTVARLLDLTP